MAADADKQQPLDSAIYEGVVTHHRLLPRTHFFSYRVAMVYLDLDELDAVFARHWAWSRERWNFASFRRADYHGKPDQSLADAVRQTIHAATGHWHAGPIRMLTNLRYFGYLINPITCYYCFDSDETLQTIVAEVTNTPWRERQAYVLPFAGKSAVDAVNFPKLMHVSPFMPMDMDYLFKAGIPGEKLGLYMENQREGERVFTASLRLQRRAMAKANMAKLLSRYPFMTMQVAIGIYWQALRLWWMQIPFVPHPRKKTAHAEAADRHKKLQSDQGN